MSGWKSITFWSCAFERREPRLRTSAFLVRNVPSVPTGAREAPHLVHPPPRTLSFPLTHTHTHTHTQTTCVCDTHTHACQVCVSWLKAFGLKYGSPKRGQRLGGCDAVRRALGSSAPQAARAGAECEHCAWAPQLHGMGHEAPQSQSSHCVPAEFAHAGARGPVQAA
jgi:hypothetical protein